MARRVFSWLVSAVALRGFPDTQCGLKGFEGAVARELFPRLRVAGFGFDVELLVMAREMGIPVARVPVKLVQNQGSSVRLLRDSLRMLKELVVVAGRKRAGAYGRPR